ncbi:hypothetical protein J2808_004433 [Pseudarthrobacter sulfonivorans]|nr:hypothetical protein [Pseudarthrobacter sulfonivorans]
MNSGGHRCGKGITTACSLTPKENRLLSRRVANDEAALTGLLTAVLALAAGLGVLGVTNLNRSGVALLIGLPAA